LRNSKTKLCLASLKLILLIRLFENNLVAIFEFFVPFYLNLCTRVDKIKPHCHLSFTILCRENFFTDRHLFGDDKYTSMTSVYHDNNQFITQVLIGIRKILVVLVFFLKDCKISFFFRCFLCQTASFVFLIILRFNQNTFMVFISFFIYQIKVTIIPMKNVCHFHYFIVFLIVLQK